MFGASTFFSFSFCLLFVLTRISHIPIPSSDVVCYSRVCAEVWTYFRWDFRIYFGDTPEVEVSSFTVCSDWLLVRCSGHLRSIEPAFLHDRLFPRTEPRFYWPTITIKHLSHTNTSANNEDDKFPVVVSWTKRGIIHIPAVRLSGSSECNQQCWSDGGVINRSSQGIMIVHLDSCQLCSYVQHCRRWLW